MAVKIFKYSSSKLRYDECKGVTHYIYTIVIPAKSKKRQKKLEAP